MKIRFHARSRDAARVVIPGRTAGVKTAISVPADTFDEATRRARELGMSRSEFFAVAARRYLDELTARSVTEQINQALDAVADDDSAAVAVGSAKRRLRDEDAW